MLLSATSVPQDGTCVPYRELSALEELRGLSVRVVGGRSIKAGDRPVPNRRRLVPLPPVGTR